jgi:anthranilate synthase component II
VLPETVNGDLQITAVNEDNLVMGLRHKRFDVHGVQFHPESIMTPEGPKMIENWLKAGKKS